MEPNQQLNNNPSNNNLDLNSSFLQHNGFNHSNDHQDSKNDTSPPVKFSDIEMIAIQSSTYISLKDILSTSPVLSPTHSSWNELTLKDPLVKQAARAYLQPMSTPPETSDKGLFCRFKERCCNGCFGFVSWFRQVVDRTFGRGDHCDEDCDEDYCDDDDHYHEKFY